MGGALLLRDPVVINTCRGRAESGNKAMALGGEGRERAFWDAGP